MEYRESCSSTENDEISRIPSYLEPAPPIHQYRRILPGQKGTNLLELFNTECQEMVQVYLRVKPCNVPTNNLYEVRSDQCLVTSLDTTTMGHGRRTQHNVSKMYTFSHVFKPECTQKEIFERVVKENLKKLPDGHNFTLLTYGASGSGKTFTLMGTVAAPGLVPRSLEYVFKMVDVAQQPLFKPCDCGTEKLDYNKQMYELQWVTNLRKISVPVRNKYKRMSTLLHQEFTVSTVDLSKVTQYYVWVSFVEIYNEAVYDLLVSTDRRSSSKLRIREDKSGNFFVQGATQAFVRSGQEAFDVMAAGKHHLQVAATGVHAHSSRSHCIFTITMLTEIEGSVRASVVRLCDLAGCERAARTRNTGARMQESRAINSSLHVLERCLHVLRRNHEHARLDPALVPYRESKLTRLLGAGLCGRGEAVSMVVTVNPAPAALAETRHVLQLAAVAKDIQVNNTMAEFESSECSSRDTTIQSNAELIKLRAENETLKFELIQFESRIKELEATMTEKQQKTADTMNEIVEDAKDMYRQYYEDQMNSLKTEMEDMKEDYESVIHKLKLEICASTDSHKHLREVSQLNLKITMLKEKLAAEQMARKSVEQEILHLRACIEERDEKSSLECLMPRTEPMELYDSEDESDEDPANESLEPTFSKQNIYLSKIRQTMSIDNDVSLNTESEDDSKHATSVRESTYINDLTNETESDSTQSDDSLSIVDVDSKVSTVKKMSRETYYKDVNLDDSSKKSESCRGTYFVKNNEFISPQVDADVEEKTEKAIDNNNPKSIAKLSTITTLTRSADMSLLQFEQLERDAQNCKHRENEILLSNIKILNEKRTYFDEKSQDNIKRGIFDNNEPLINKSDEITIKKEPKDIEEGIINNEVSFPDNDDFTSNNESNTSKNDSFPINEVMKSTIERNLIKTHLSMDLFDSPNTGAKTEGVTTSCIEKNVPINEEVRNNNQTRIDANTFVATKVEPVKEITIIDDINQLHITNSEGNNTSECFEILSKDVTARDAEFEMLLSSSTNNREDKNNDNYLNKSLERKPYNLRKKVNCKDENDDPIVDLLAESKDSCMSKAKSTKKKLTLRKKNNDDESYKLKDIANLQGQFSDAILDTPAHKESKDASPKTVIKNEGLAPLLDYGKSCPSKSIMRSRRKLFTPQPESLEQSVHSAGGSTERLLVPRPSYHRTTRARRKL